MQRTHSLANSLQNNEALITIANVAKNGPFSTFWCTYVNSLTNNIHEWCSDIMPQEFVYIDIRLEN